MKTSRSRCSEAGDTLVEVLLAIVILGIASVAILLAFGTTISGSAEHRTLTTYDTALRSMATEVTTQLQQQPNTAWATCTGTSLVTFNSANVPSGYTPTISSTAYWNGSSFVSTCQPYAQMLVTVSVSHNGVTNSLSFVVGDPTAKPVPPAGTATQLAFVGQPGNGVSGSTLSNPPAVAVEDSTGRVVTNDLSRVVLTISVASGTPGASISNCSGAEFYGVITFSNCSVTTAGTGYTLTATDGTLTPATSNPFNVTAAAPAQLVFNPATPGPGVAGRAIPGVSVQVQDSYGNVVTTAAGSVSLSIASGTQSGFSAGTATVAVSNGVASFPDLVIDLVGSYTLTATPVGITGLTTTNDSNAFAVTPASPNSVLVANPGPQTAGTAFGDLLTVLDAYGNVATSYSGAQTVSFSGPANSPSGASASYPTSVTFVAGIGTASGITLVDAQSTPLTVSTGGVGGTSTAFTVSASTASRFTMSTPTPTAGSAFNETLAATDIYGNPVSTYAGSKAVIFSGPSSSPNATAPTYPPKVTFTGGMGTASVKLVNAQTTTLSATQGSVVGTSGSFTVAPAAAAKLAFSPTTPGPGTVNVAIPNLSVQVLDTYGNLATTTAGSVTMSIKAGSAQAAFTSGTTTVALSSGVAAFSNLVVATSGNYTLTATPVGFSGVAAVNSGAFTVNALPNITTLTLPGATLSGSYSQTLAVSGGTSPYTWSLANGSLPAGLSLNVATGVVSGTVGATATSQTFTVMVADANGASDTQALSITVNAVPNITTSTLASATKTGAYSQTLALTGGTPAYTWSLISGTLPTGLSLGASTGVISGTVTNAATTQSFTVKVTDADGVTDTAALTITVNAAPTVTTSSVPGATKTGTYSQTLAASGGTTPLLWGVSGGTLPAGLSLNATTGVISGTVANTATSQTFTVMVADANAVTDTQSLTIAVNAVPTISTTTLAAGTKTGAYSKSVTGTGGTTPYAWTVTSGSLPSGLTLNSSTGVISGTVASSASTQTFTVTLTDADLVTASQVLTLTVNVAPNITTTTLPNGTKTGAYSQTLAVSGGTSSYTWSVSSGSLPSGLTLGPSTGVISGTIGSGASTQSFTVTVTDANGVADPQALTLTVNAAPTISTTSLPNAVTGSSYSQTVAATGGTTPYTWSITGGALPTGLSINASTGVISGTPSGTKKTYSFTVQVKDANLVVGTKSLSITLT